MLSFWAVILIALLSLPLTMLLFGFTFKRSAPSYNYMFGYKTRRSLQSEASWYFAHRYFGKVWFIEGVLLVALTTVVMLFALNADSELLGMLALTLAGVELAAFVIAILLTENALKKEFDDL